MLHKNEFYHKSTLTCTYCSTSVKLLATNNLGFIDLKVSVPLVLFHVMDQPL